MKCEKTRREIDFCSASRAPETILQGGFFYISLKPTAWINSIIYPALPLTIRLLDLCLNTLIHTGHNAGGHGKKPRALRGVNASLSSAVPSPGTKTPQLSGNAGGREPSGQRRAVAAPDRESGRVVICAHLHLQQILPPVLACWLTRYNGSMLDSGHKRSPFPGQIHYAYVHSRPYWSSISLPPSLPLKVQLLCPPQSQTFM